MKEVGAFGEMTTMNSNDDQESRTVPPTVAQQIDENLKRLYSETTSEDLPPSLTELLNALREKDAQKKSGDE
ncbi:NepR family anti-sigma factor [Roseinatronobacter bogoriensis]|uniref:NepR family anti-sigma factor n=1 Tax=Roseinatronobacter bogoriensis TaxID=119542 RepID=UPI0008F803EF|nr:MULTISPECIES: NepR family anti-sigma factor [Rhodobaca]MBB4208978.1 hypothetical protein [Rhodobaca bogoriensis DSM 18756]